MGQRHGAAADEQTAAKGAAAGAVAATARASGGPVEFDGIFDEQHVAARDRNGATHAITTVPKVIGDGREETAEPPTCLVVNEGRVHDQDRATAHVQTAAG